MTKNLRLLASSAIIVLGFSVSQTHPIKAMEEKTPIGFVPSNGVKMMMKLNPFQTLSDLRVELSSKGRIAPNDCFQLDGAAIFPDGENDWTIKDILVNNTIFLKPGNLVSSHLFDPTATPTLEQKVKLLSIDKIPITETTKKTEKEENPQSIKEHQEAELLENQDIFAIRNLEVEFLMTQYKLLNSSKITYAELIKIMELVEAHHTVLFKTYEKNQKLRVIYEKNMKDLVAEKEDYGTTKSYAQMAWYDGSIKKKPWGSYTLARVIRDIKKDILEVMKLHQGIYNKPHPRLEEFRKIPSSPIFSAKEYNEYLNF